MMASDVAKVVRRSVSPEQLTEAREALHLSQATLARTLGVAANTVNRWEHGERTIPPYLTLALDGIEHRRQCLGRAKDG
jgi:DNA-binding transcriptional regulator YiaG